MSLLNKAKTISHYEEYLQSNFNFGKFNLNCTVNTGKKKVSTKIFFVRTNDFIRFLDADEIIFTGEDSMLKISLFNGGKKIYTFSMETLKQIFNNKTIYLTSIYRISQYNLAGKVSYSFSQTIIFFNEKGLLDFRGNELSLFKTKYGFFKEKTLGNLQQTSFVRNLEKIDVF